jgi:regulatory protein
MNLTIKPKNKSLSYLEIDDIQWGILPNKILRFFSITESSDFIREDEQQKIIIELQKYAYSRTISYLAQRERSEKEVKNYLHSLRFHHTIIESTITKLLEQNYLNNDRFAELLTNDLIAKKKSSKEIYYKLLEKGISAELAHSTLQKCYPDNSQIITEVMEKAIRKYQNHLKQKEKVIAYMFRKGFSYDEIVNNLNREMNEY